MAFTRADLERLSYAALQAEAKKLHIRATQKKTLLVDQLVDPAKRVYIISYKPGHDRLKEETNTLPSHHRVTAPVPAASIASGSAQDTASKTRPTAHAPTRSPTAPTPCNRAEELAPNVIMRYAGVGGTSSMMPEGPPLSDAEVDDIRVRLFWIFFPDSTYLDSEELAKADEHFARLEYAPVTNGPDQVTKLGRVLFLICLLRETVVAAAPGCAALLQRAYELMQPGRWAPGARTRQLAALATRSLAVRVLVEPLYAQQFGPWPAPDAIDVAPAAKGAALARERPARRARIEAAERARRRRKQRRDSASPPALLRAETLPYAPGMPTGDRWSVEPQDGDGHGASVRPGPNGTAALQPDADDGGEPALARDWADDVLAVFSRPLRAHRMREAARVFDRLERTELALGDLQEAGLPDAMRHVAEYEHRIVDDAQHRFRERAQALLVRWGPMPGEIADAYSKETNVDRGGAVPDGMPARLDETHTLPPPSISQVARQQPRHKAGADVFPALLLSPAEADDAADVEDDVLDPAVDADPSTDADLCTAPDATSPPLGAVQTALTHARAALAALQADTAGVLTEADELRGRAEAARKRAAAWERAAVELAGFGADTDNNAEMKADGDECEQEGEKRASEDLHGTKRKRVDELDAGRIQYHVAAKRGCTVGS